MNDNFSSRDYDHELGLTDKVKYVDFQIRFTKADHQTLLYEETAFPVNYSTNSNSFAALRVSDYKARLAGGIQIPAAWRSGNHPSGDYGYDNSENPTTYSRIPQQDEEHIEFRIAEVDSSSEKKEVSEVDAIREVRDAIKEGFSSMWD